MAAWQTMDTAPKDGTLILGAYASSGRFDADFSLISWDGKDWAGYCDGERSIRAQGDCFTDYHEPYCTHWMPLPDAPSTSQSKERE